MSVQLPTVPVYAMTGSGKKEHIIKDGMTKTYCGVIAQYRSHVAANPAMADVCTNCFVNAGVNGVAV